MKLPNKRATNLICVALLVAAFAIGYARQGNSYKLTQAIIGAIK